MHNAIVIVLTALLAATFTLVSARGVVSLTDKSFEHLTQAATGATTGVWFVKFYAPVRPAWHSSFS